MSKKGLTWVIGVIALLVVVIGLGPILVAKTARRVFKKPQFSTANPINIKANGKISSVDNYLILTSPKGINTYILTGNKVAELQQYAHQNETLYVFGSLMAADPKEIGGTPIRARIDVTMFDKKDFTIGNNVSSQVAAAIKAKVEEKNAFQQTVFKKLGMRDSQLTVIAGNLKVLGCSYQGKPATCLMIEDKYGDRYLLNGSPVFTALHNKVTSMDGMPVVVLGSVSFPDSALIVNEKNYVTFGFRQLYNNDLAPLNVD